MKRTAVLLVLSLALLAHLASATVPEDLEKNGLPVGLLPGSVKSYTLNEDGTFVVYLEEPCYAKIDDQLVYYAANISGVLKFGKINSLDGIETKQLFVWLPVTGIYVDDPASPYIYFQVGVLTKRLAVAIFESAPKCTSHAVKDRVESFSEAVKEAVMTNFGNSAPRKALQ
jgi:hypothetical protein